MELFCILSQMTAWMPSLQSGDGKRKNLSLWIYIAFTNALMLWLEKPFHSLSWSHWERNYLCFFNLTYHILRVQKFSEVSLFLGLSAITNHFFCEGVFSVKRTWNNCCSRDRRVHCSRRCFECSYDFGVMIIFHLSSLINILTVGRVPCYNSHFIPFVPLRNCTGAVCLRRCLENTTCDY